MSQAVHSDLFLHADDSGLTFQHKDVHTIENQSNKDFANLCDQPNTFFQELTLFLHKFCLC